MPDIASIGLPASAAVLALGLVRGAKALEKDANPQALKYVSDLLTKGDLRNIGKAGAGLVPFVFGKAFGPRPFSFLFISRSIIFTTVFWLILLWLKHVNLKHSVIDDIAAKWQFYVSLIPLWYILDWLSLLKARYLITMVSEKRPIISSACFLLVDIFLSYFLAYIWFLVIIGAYLTYLLPWDTATSTVKQNLFEPTIFRPITDYFDVDDILLADVTIPSTLLTSVWTFLLFLSSLVAQLLVPIDYLRRFTRWWFRDVEHHPLTAIAKVAATLIVVGAFVITIPGAVRSAIAASLVP